MRGWLRERLPWPLLAASLALGGCAGMEQSPCYHRPLSTLLDSTNLKAMFASMAVELCQSPCGQDCGAERQACPSEAARQTILVTDFANLDTYIPGQHGLLMGESMRAALSSGCQSRIVQAEFGKHFKLSEQGLVALTRKVDEIRRDELPYQEAVVGTYSFQGGKLIIFARKIDSRTGVVTRMVSREVNFTCGQNSITSRVN